MYDFLYKHIEGMNMNERVTMTLPEDDEELVDSTTVPDGMCDTAHKNSGERSSVSFSEPGKKWIENPLLYPG